jgi:hypothetical protein
MSDDLRTPEEIMEAILGNFRKVESDWEKISEKYSVAGARRIRKALDEISKQKVELRKSMLKKERE